MFYACFFWLIRKYFTHLPSTDEEKHCTFDIPIPLLINGLQCGTKLLRVVIFAVFSAIPQKSFTLTVDLFKIPDVNQRLKRRHTAPAFHTIFHQVFGLVRNQHEFPTCRIDFNPRTYFVRPKTCYCQRQSSQCPIFPFQAWGQSFTRVARNETKYESSISR